MERLFDLTWQTLFDGAVLALAMFVLFFFLSYVLFEPIRDVLEKRRQKVVEDQETAKLQREKGIAYKEVYEGKLSTVEKEAEEILRIAQKNAQKNEAKIIAEAKEEAARIIQRANSEIELEKKRAVDEMKQEVVAIASLMAEKVVAASIDPKTHDSLVEETLKEMGDNTWVN